MINRKNKIFFISTEYPPFPGGIGTHAYNVLEQLRNRGWDTVVATNQEYAAEEEIEIFNAKQQYPIIRLHTSLTMIELIKKIFFLIKLVRKHKPDIVMGSGRHACYFAYLAAIFNFKKCVLVGHGSEFIMELSQRSKIINKWVYSKAYSIVYVSYYTQKVAEQNGIFNKRPQILYNGANNDFFKVIPLNEIKEFKTKEGVEKQKIILTTGSLSDRKGQETVIRAMPAIIKQYPDAHYYSIGYARQGILAKMLELSKQLGVENNVHILGYRDNDTVLNWMNAADIYILPSTVVENKDIEGFGISVIEAALCKKPAVVTNQSGAMESVEPGVTGLIAEMGNSESIAKQISKLLADENLRMKMGENAMERAQKHFTWVKATAEYEKYFFRILGR